MQGNRSRDTSPELALRRRLHTNGLRYRVCARPLPELRRNVDIVFRKAKVAVEVRGCYWHGCPEHYRPPHTNSEYWTTKITKNIARDQEMDRRLTEAGWLVVVVWEHDDLAEATDRVIEAVRSRRAPRSRTTNPL